MKADTHPTYHDNTTVTCACGNTFSVGSTAKEISVEVCSACHPFYTGVDKTVDTAGRVEKFKARREAAQKTKKTPAQASKAPAKPKKKATKKTAAKK